MAPLDWVNTAVVAARDAVPSAYEVTGMSCASDKADLRPGDHVYAWKLGYTYNHHGIVVRTSSCTPHCKHEGLDCCAIVHFSPPTDNIPGRIELASAAEFAQGRQLCRVRYQVTQAEFYVRRSGCCSTETPDVWPVVVLRALSLLEIGSPDASDNAAAQVEYDMMTKNSELLARWCQIGDASGVHRFRSSETAWSLQTSPGRFVRLGFAIAVPTAVAAAAATIAAASGGAAAASVTASSGAAVSASSGAGAPAAAGAAAAGAVAAGEAGTSAAAATAAGAAAASSARVAAGAVGPTAAKAWANAASSTAARLSSEALVAGGVAASSAARELLIDALRRPQRARDVLTQAARAVPIPGARSTRWRHSIQEQQRYEEQQGAAVVAALRDFVVHMGVTVPKTLRPLFDSPTSCCTFCEVLVDLLEDTKPSVLPACAALVQQLLDELQG